jgi:hypothetical protein
MIDEKFIIIGLALQLWGILVYTRDTLRGKTKPNRVSWFFWFLAPAIAFVAEIDKGVGLLALMTFSVGFGPLIVLAASFVNKKSYWHLHWSDYLCGLFALLGILLWLIYRDSNFAIVLSIVADIFAALPTLIKSFKYPETESWEAYWPTVINALIALLVIQTWSVAHYGFPIYIFIINIIFVLLIRFKLGLRIMNKRA